MSADRLAGYATDPVAFIDDYIRVNELGRPFVLQPHQREILRLAFTFDDTGRLPWDTLVYACRKKSGKTTIGGAVLTWWGYTQEPPNDLRCFANDLEQSQGGVFKTTCRLIQNNPELAKSARIEARRIVLSNSTETTSHASEAPGAAGPNQGGTWWDELWGYTSESSRRLWEEMTPVPTRRNSIRFITTYAGFEGESALLWDLYKQGVDREEHPDGQGERIHPTLPVYLNREARLCVYWDHEARMPWQTPEYYASQRRALRPSAYLRLHENRWATAESPFLSPELWDACVDRALTPLLPCRDFPLFVGVDASTKHDSTAVVSVHWEVGKRRRNARAGDA
jgi:phage terminase large subunit-like protein